MALKTLLDIAGMYGGKSIGDVEPLRKNFGTMSDEEIMETVHVLNHLWTDLRQSAIEWIKWFRNNLDIKKIYETTNMSSSELYAVAVDKETVKKWDIEQARRLSVQRDAIARWIIDFFNITEEDLK
jgi:hypothetical protein